jgi:hypothetical protein
MRLSSRSAIASLVLGALMLGLAASGWAENGNEYGTSDGATSAYLAGQLYCQTKDLVSGNIGILVGLTLVFIGIWNLITGKGWFGAVLAIIMGAIIPSLPGLVEGFLIGYNNLMVESGLSPSNQGFDISKFKCSGGELVEKPKLGSREQMCLSGQGC